MLHTSFLSLLLTNVSIARQSFPADEGRLLPFKLPAWVIQLVPKSRQVKYAEKACRSASGNEVRTKPELEVSGPDTWQSRAREPRLEQAGKHHV